MNGTNLVIASEGPWNLEMAGRDRPGRDLRDARVRNLPSCRGFGVHGMSRTFRKRETWAGDGDSGPPAAQRSVRSIHVIHADS